MLSNVNRKIYIILAFVIATIFWIDYNIPLGVAGGVPYIVVVLISLQLKNTRITCFISIFCIGLTILGYILSPIGGLLWMVLSNRLLAILAISITGYLGIRLKNSEMETRKIADMPSENPNPVFRISYDNKILYANQSACNLFGCKNSEGSITALPIQWEETLNKVVHKGESEDVEYIWAGKILSFHFTNVHDRNYINIYGTDISALKKTEQKLKNLSEIDELTGLYNRRIFNKTIALEWKRSKRFKNPLSLFMIDVDYFKKYNDTFGHQAGDKALRAVGKVLKKLFNRPGDFVARYGGEEFVVLLPATSESGATLLAENLRQRIEEKKIMHRKSNVADHVTVSIGVATANPEDRLKGKELISVADKALYKAKASGRNRIILGKQSNS
ncbi:MAG: GGDEF domain-containing protein [Leptospirales bacterium]